jgi:hypothetical protein
MKCHINSDFSSRFFYIGDLCEDSRDSRAGMRWWQRFLARSPKNSYSQPVHNIRIMNLYGVPSLLSIVAWQYNSQTAHTILTK